MLNSAELTLAHKNAYTLIDKWFRLQHLIDFWGKHPILSWNLHCNKRIVSQPYVSVDGKRAQGLTFKRLSERYCIVAFHYDQFPKVYYVDKVTPETNARVHREMITFFKTYKALEAAKFSDYMMDDPRERGKRYTGTYYGNGR